MLTESASRDETRIRTYNQSTSPRPWAVMLTESASRDETRIRTYNQSTSPRPWAVS